MHPQVVRLTPPLLSEVELFATEVRSWGVRDVPLAQPAEVATFATDKRREEHLSGRWLLGQALLRWGVDDLSVLEVVRDEHRAPSLAYIHGVWKRTPLPNISIAHSEGMVFVALVNERLSVGFDAEPLERTLAENAYDMMAKGEELERLRSSPSHVFQAWTGKEAVQKCLGLGMHLNPRHIQIPIGNDTTEISIENSKIQLTNDEPGDVKSNLSREQRLDLLNELKSAMKEAAKQLDFEEAARLRDRIFELQQTL